MKRIPNSYYDIPHIPVENYDFTDIDREVFTKNFANKNCIVALEKTDKILTVCMGKPNKKLYEKLRKEMGCFIAVVRSCPKEVLKTILKVAFLASSSSSNFASLAC